LAKADPRAPGLMEIVIKIGSPVVSPHQFSLNPTWEFRPEIRPLELKEKLRNSYNRCGM
jgi:hypothetical protein